MTDKDVPFSEYVEHPRYGREPRHTGLQVEGDVARGVYLHWNTSAADRVPRTAVPADTSLQNAQYFFVTHYYDTKKRCRDCRRMFLFFAEEQKFWYERLRFPLYVDCVRCSRCRKAKQMVASARRRYDNLYASAHRSDSETLELASLGLDLSAAGFFGRIVPERVRCLLRSLPADSAIRTSKAYADLDARSKFMTRSGEQSVAPKPPYGPD